MDKIIAKIFASNLPHLSVVVKHVIDLRLWQEPHRVWPILPREGEHFQKDEVVL